MAKRKDATAKKLGRIIQSAAFRNPEIAERAGTSTDQLNNWRFGKSQPTPEALDRLANGFDAKARELWGLSVELRSLASDLRGVAQPLPTMEALRARAERVGELTMPVYANIASSLVSEMRRLQERLNELEKDRD